jgi:hypothetical protein
MNLIEMKSRATCYPDADKIIKPTGKLTTIGEPIIVPGIDDPNSLIKNPCNTCPWNNQLWIGGSHLHIGDTPCQWCEHGTKLTCADKTKLTCVEVLDRNDLSSYLTTRVNNNE